MFGTGGTTSGPKLSVLPSDFFVDEICRDWSSPTSSDVLLNCNTGSELGSMHPFYNRLAEHAGATVVPLGGIGASHRHDTSILRGNSHRGASKRTSLGRSHCAVGLSTCVLVRSRTFGLATSVEFVL